MKINSEDLDFLISLEDVIYHEVVKYHKDDKYYFNMLNSLLNLNERLIKERETEKIFYRGLFE